MRYFLIAVAIGGVLYFVWAGSGPGAIVPAPLALVWGLAAIGLIKRQAWAAYLLSVLAFIGAAFFAFALLVALADTASVASAGSVAGWLAVVGLLALAVTVGGMATLHGRELRREGLVPK